MHSEIDKCTGSTDDATGNWSMGKGTILHKAYVLCFAYKANKQKMAALILIPDT